MAYARPFGQAQNASPWTAGVPPGIQPPQPAGQQTQPMFGQPMGPFDLSGGWQNQQQAGPQWMPAMQQPVQFVPNPAAYMQNQNQHQMHRQQPHLRPHQQQRPMHQRSLSAPRVSANGPNKRQFNNYNSGGQQRNYNNNSNNQQQQRTPRQQSRMNNNNNSNNNNNNDQQHNKQQQQQQPNQQQAQKKGTAKVVKVTKVKKLNALKTKQGVNTADTDTKAEPAAQPATDKDQCNGEKVQSKTAERKQLKLQARKNAEALNQSVLPVSKINTGSNAPADEPIDEAQLKCVPAVFGFVCKICDVFLKDKIARREHIDSADHMNKFNLMEEEQNQKSAEDNKEKEEEVEPKGEPEANAEPQPQPEAEEQPKAEASEEEPRAGDAMNQSSS